MAEDDDKLNSEEISKLDNLNWSDITNELIKNKEMVRAEQTIEPTQNAPGRTHSLELDFLYDLPLELRIEVGGKKVMISDVIDFRLGAIVELDKAIGHPLEIFVNDVLVGYGVVVEQDKKYGIKITEILNAEERLASLHSKSSAI